MPLQRYLLTSQANLAFLGRFFCTGQQQLWRGTWNVKIIFSRPLFTIILSQKWCQISVRSFCVLPGTKNLQCLCSIKWKKIGSNGFRSRRRRRVQDLCFRHDLMWKAEKRKKKGGVWGVYCSTVELSDETIFFRKNKISWWWMKMFLLWQIITIITDWK